MLAHLAASGDWGRYHGPWCERLAAELAQRLQTTHVLLCSSGTAAVELALRGLGIGPGDEVLLAAYDFKANFTNVLCVGATPVLVDVREDDCQLDVTQLDAARSPRTRCVIASHLHGGMVDVSRLGDWCTARGIAWLEDACQASGGAIAGKPAGTSGDVGVLSFGGSKLLTAGRGGAIVTARADVAQRIRLYTQRGNDAYPLSEMQAAVLLPQIERLADRHAQRRRAVEYLCPRLQALGLTPLRSTADVADPAYYKLGLRHEPSTWDGLSRDALAAAARAEGIALDSGFRALHRIHARRRFRAVGPLPLAEAADAGLLALHHPALLGTPDELRLLVGALERLQAHREELVRYFTPLSAG